MSRARQELLSALLGEHTSKPRLQLDIPDYDWIEKQISLPLSMAYHSRSLSLRYLHLLVVRSKVVAIP